MNVNKRALLLTLTFPIWCVPAILIWTLSMMLGNVYWMCCKLDENLIIRKQQRDHNDESQR